MTLRRTLLGLGGLLLVTATVAVWLQRGGANRHTLTQVGEGPGPPGSSAANGEALPAAFAQLLRDRATLDLNQQLLHEVDQELWPAPRILPPVHSVHAASLRVLSSSVSVDALAYRRALPDNQLPMRGFRAGILEEKTNFWPALVETGRCDAVSLSAAAVIDQRLFQDGVVLTLARTLQTLGPAYQTNSPSQLLTHLRELGYPTDLLAYFPVESATADPEGLVAFICRKLLAGRKADDLRPELQKIPFRFQPARPGFRVATESGEETLGMLRLQIGGGYRSGIIPGGTLDLACQLVNALPDVDFIMSVPEIVRTPFESICRNQLNLVRPTQLTLLVEPLPISAWAQDNGKAGVLNGSAGRVWATMVPRYASKGEEASTFLPGDTFLAEGWAAAGHEVAQSSLLYQGGNLLAVREPASGRRILLVGEASVHANTALGLTVEQTMEAFRMEFGVDECVEVPAVSFHIDFDLSVRVRDGQLILFVNDCKEAARLILQTGAEALAKGGLLDASALTIVRQAVASDNDRVLFETLAPFVYRHLNARGQFPAGLARHFQVMPQDAPTENLRCFLVALEVVGSQVLIGKAAPQNAVMRDYLSSMGRLLEASARQVNALRKLRWQIVAVPSMPDLTPSINYLNGIHDTGRFLVPVYGGFYKDVDAAALKVFTEALGPKVELIPFSTVESQRQHGAIHCAAAAYPKL